MNEFSIVLLVALIAVSLAAVVVFAVYSKKNFGSLKGRKVIPSDMPHEIEKKIDTKLLSFRSHKDCFRGEDYVDLIDLGYFSTLKTGNHGEEFDDRRQLQTSRDFSTPSIVAALKKVGETFERYYI
ncbi:MAG: hypothetical protein LBK75_02155 [Oscillospiraceae bacterium]|nr:hypothetical protein [Oscillospiraceae bacterium]